MSEMLKAVQAMADGIERARAGTPMDEPDAYFRVYAWAAGRILSDDDVADLQRVLADHNDALGEAAQAFGHGYDEAMTKVDRADVASLVKDVDALKGKIAIEKALRVMAERRFAICAANADQPHKK